jgi:glycine/D-amino acid oxidase-like deaminating enzyme/nitrite reductase/ring-hydroxylating ferredoxin subunit
MADQDRSSSAGEPARTAQSAGTHPVWHGEGASARFLPLHGHLDVDVAVIGAGVVGSLTGYFAKRAGLRVALIDADVVGGGETSRTTAHVTAQLDARWKKVVADLGPERARLLWSHASNGIDALEELIAELGVACGWRRVGAWLFTESSAGLGALRDEAEAAARAGIPARFVDSGVPTPWPAAGAVYFPNQAQLDPAPLMQALARAIDGGGSLVHEHTRALEVTDEERPAVHTEHGSLRARHVVVATHAPFNNRVMLQTKIAHYRTYVIALSTERPLANALLWDDQEPYHYLRTHVRDGQELWIVGGEDHRTGQSENTQVRLQALEHWILERIPDARFHCRWSGQVLEPVDGLPYVGRNSLEHNVLTATGFSGTGWAYGALAARILVDTLGGHEHPLARTLAATRITPRASAARYVAENVQFPWHFFGDRLSPESRRIDQLPPEHGAVFNAHGKGGKLAVYRDAHNELHAVSAVCPHLGCIVAFNAVESSWDCPCHGSRFGVTGELMSGPAARGLDPVAAPATRTP